MDKVSINFNLPKYFSHGTATEDSVLKRPIKKYLKTGAPIGRFAYVFYQESDNVPAKVLGTFVYTAKERIIFFPGLLNRKYLWKTKQDRKLLGKSIDHLTLEKDLNNWHVTSDESRKKDVHKTYKMSEGIYYWFGFSLRDKDCLEIIPTNTEIIFESPTTDSNRRMQEFIDARDQSQFPRLIMDNNKPDNHLVHFDFIIDIRPIDKRTIGPLLVVQPPFKKPVLLEDVEVQDKFVSKFVNIKIPDFDGDIIMNAVYSRGNLVSEGMVTMINNK